MNLSTLNSPAIVGSLGVLCLYVFERSQKQDTFFLNENNLSFTTLKSMNLLAYILQTIAVSIPGRIDSEVAKAMSNESNESSSSDSGEDEISPMAQALLPSTGTSLIALSGWAFAIWGPIFLGEALIVICQWFVSESSSLAPLLRQMSIPFIFAQLFQTLWTASFRPKYTGYWSYVSAIFLGCTAYALSKAHAVYTVDAAKIMSSAMSEDGTTANINKPYTFGQFLVFFLPISLHFGWTTAATLLNINGAFVTTSFPNRNNATKDDYYSTYHASIAVVGYLSVILATVLGTWIGWKRSSAVYPGVIAWALFAVAGGMTQRFSALSKLAGEYVINKSVLDSVIAQRILSRIGAWICVGMSLVIRLQMWNIGSSSTTDIPNSEM